MTPFVIDNQVRRRYILVFVLLLIASFALGYVSGFYMGLLDKAEVPVVSDAPEELPDQTTQDESTPEIPEKGDVAPKPEVKSDVSPPAKTEKNTVAVTPPKINKPTPAPNPVSQVKETKSSSVKSTIDVKPEPVKQASQVSVAVVTETKKTEPVAEKIQSPIKAEQDAPDNTGEISMVVEGSANVFQDSQRMFSVQVGVFANRENALNLVEELKNGGFDAYLDDFVASGGEVKYNVRFGRESDRGLIQQQLTKYKQQFSTSAYIIITK